MHSIKQHSNCRHPQQVGRDYIAHQMASQLDPPTEVHKHSEQTPSWTRPSSTLLGSSKSTTNRPRSLWTHDAEDGTSRRCSMQLWWSQADGRTYYKLLPRHKVLWWLSCLGQGSNRLVAQTEHWYIKLSSSNCIRTNAYRQRPGDKRTINTTTVTPPSGCLHDNTRWCLALCKFNKLYETKVRFGTFVVYLFEFYNAHNQIW